MKGEGASRVPVSSNSRELMRSPNGRTTVTSNNGAQLRVSPRADVTAIPRPRVMDFQCWIPRIFLQLPLVGLDRLSLALHAIPAFALESRRVAGTGPVLEGLCQNFQKRPILAFAPSCAASMLGQLG